MTSSSEQELVKHLSRAIGGELEVEVRGVGNDDREAEYVDQRCGPGGMGGFRQRRDGSTCEKVA